MKARFIHIRLPEEMIEELDAIVEKSNYTTRNELVRDVLRDVISANASRGA